MEEFSSFYEKNTLDLRESKNVKKIFGRQIKDCQNWLTTSKTQCSRHFSEYSIERIVTCLDLISHSEEIYNGNQYKIFEGTFNRNDSIRPTNKKKKLYFSFIGDSRVRQQFSNFIKVIII